MFDKLRIKKLILYICDTSPRELIKILYKHGYPAPQDREDVLEGTYIFYQDTPELAIKEFMRIHPDRSYLGDYSMRNDSFEQEEFCGCNKFSDEFCGCNNFEEDSFCGNNPNCNCNKSKKYVAPSRNNTITFDSYYGELTPSDENRKNWFVFLTISIIVLVLILISKE